MGWLRQLKESYWQPSQVDQIDSKLEPLRLGDTSAAQQSPIERFVEVERDLGRLTLVTQALVEVCVRKGLLSHDEIAEIVGDVDLSLPTDARWGAAATERPSLPLTLAGNSYAAGGPARAASSVGVIDDFENAESWGNDEEPTEVEGDTALATTSLATTDGGFDFGGGDIDSRSAIDVGGEENKEGVASIPRTAPFPKPKRKQQKSSAMRQIIGMALSGVIGLGIGYFILLWFTGQDIIKAAPMLPNWMKPAEFRTDGSTNTAPVAQKNPGDLDSFPAAQGELPDMKDLERFNGAGKHGGGSTVAKSKEEMSFLEEATATGGGNDPTSFIDPTPTDDPLTPSLSIEPPVIAPKTAAKTDEPEVSVNVPSPIETPEPTTDPTPVPTPEATTSPSDDPAAPFEPKKFVVQDAVAVDGQTLGDAYKAANLAAIDLSTGSLNDDDAKRTKVAAYQKFCELAKALTFVDGEPMANQLETRILAAEKVATLAVEEEAIFNDVAVIANQWIGLPADRRSTSGVFLTGTVKDVQSAGELKRVMVDLGNDRLVTIVTTPEADVIETDRVAVLGVIVEAPTTELAGYEGPEEKAIWSEHVIKAETPLSPLE